MEAERRKEVAALGARLVERLAKGETLQALAAETDAKVEKTAPVTRTTPVPALSQSAVQQAFALPKGKATSASTVDGKGRTVLMVAEVVPAPPATAEQTERLKSEVERQMQQDILAEYVAGLQARYGLSVNDAALKQALGTPGRDQPEE